MTTPRRTDRSWRLILDAGEQGPADGPTNMATDHALLASVSAGAPPVLRLYRWAPATLSFGRNQPARGLYDATAAADRGIAFVRRPTGGQAVLHDNELTYAVVAPVAVIGKPREAYRRINEALVVALRTLGVEAEVASGGSGRGRGQGVGHGQGPVQGQGQGSRSWAEACFRRAERGEVHAGGRKLVGSAQRTEGRTILQHGSILLGGSQSAAEALLRDPITSVARREGGWTTLEAELGERSPAIDELVEAVVAAFESVFGIPLAPSTLEPGEATAARELREEFASAEWTWRR